MTGSSRRYWLYALIVALFQVGCVFAEVVEFQSSFEHWVIPAEKRFRNRLLVSVRDNQTKKPVKGLTIGAICRLPQGRLAPLRQASAGAGEMTTQTDDNGEASFYYWYDHEAGAAHNTVTYPRQEVVKVYCTSFGYQEDVRLGVGMDLLVKKASPVLSQPYYPLETIPVEVLVSDAFHPQFPLSSWPGLLDRARLEIVVEAPSETRIPVVALPMDACFGNYFEKALKNGLDFPRVGLFNNSGLQAEYGGGGSWYLKTVSGVPCLMVREGGDYQLKLSVSGIVGDAEPTNEEVKLVLPVRQPPASPFDNVLRATAMKIPRAIRFKTRYLYYFLDISDFIGFGRELSSFFSDMAVVANSGSGPAIEDMECRLMSYFLVNSFEDYASMTKKKQDAFSARAKSTESGKADLLVTDWIDPVVFGYLSSNPGKRIVLLQKKPGIEQLGKAACVTCGEAVFKAAGKGGFTGKADEAILEPDGGGFVALTLPSTAATEKMKIWIDRCVARIIAYWIEDDALLIFNALLEDPQPGWFEFDTSIEGKGRATIYASDGVAVLKKLTGQMAASALQAPGIGECSIPAGAELTSQPAKLSIFVNKGELPVAWEKARLVIDKRRVKIPELIANRMLLPLDAAAPPGIHSFCLTIEDRLGHGDRVTGYYLIKGEPKALYSRPLWSVASRSAAEARMAARASAPAKKPGVKRPVRLPEKKPRRDGAVNSTPDDAFNLPDDDADDADEADGAEGASSSGNRREQDVRKDRENPSISGLDPVDSAFARSNDRVSDSDLYRYKRSSSVKADSKPGKVLPGLHVSDTVVCQYVQEGKSAGAAGVFAPNVGKIYCWFNFNNRYGRDVEVKLHWYYCYNQSWKHILASPRLLPPGEGSAYSPVTCTGKPFPEGDYFVEVRMGGQVLGKVRFRVAAKR